MKREVSTTALIAPLIDASHNYDACLGKKMQNNGRRPR
jgi:hypothetical protein